MSTENWYTKNAVAPEDQLVLKFIEWFKREFNKPNVLAESYQKYAGKSDERYNLQQSEQPFANGFFLDLLTNFARIGEEVGSIGNALLFPPRDQES